MLPILLYHRVIKDKSEIRHDSIHVFEKELIKQFEYLKKKGFETITFKDLDKGVANLSNKIILTFDDGYEDNYLVLFPLLKRYEFTAVIYLVPNQTKNAWSADSEGMKVNLMTPKQIKEMQAYGVEFGAHTFNHIDLKKAKDELARTEVVESTSAVTKLLNEPCISFAYPYGAFNNQTKVFLKEAGIKYCTTTNIGSDDYKADLLEIKRIEVRPHTGLLSFKHKVSGSYYPKKNFLYPLRYLFN